MLCSVVIEVRQHLCCANVFLNFIQPVANSESLKINVDKTRIHLTDVTDGTTTVELNVEKYFTILTETFSNLVVEGENVTFRISVLDIKEFQEDISSNNNSPESLKFILKENEEVRLYCSQCEAPLTEWRKYGKIREFPSGAIDVGDFFCHHGPSFQEVLLPRLEDLFFGFQFIIVNMESVQECTKLKDGHIYCKRCKRYLGEHMFEGKAGKIWGDSCAVRKDVQQKLLNAFGSEEDYVPVSLIYKILKETSLPAPEPLLRHMHFTKVVLETCLPSREPRYLLLHILEKFLPVLKNSDVSAATATKKNLFTIILEKHFAFKILYRYIEPLTKECDNNDDNASAASYPTLFSYWQQDINILKMNISPYLFQHLLEDLNYNSLLLPKIYRNNTDQFTLSYIFQ